MEKTQFVIYNGIDEVLVTTPENEDALLREFFDKGGRNLDDYSRTVSVEVAVEIQAELNAR